MRFMCRPNPCLAESFSHRMLRFHHTSLPKFRVPAPHSAPRYLVQIYGVFPTITNSEYIPDFRAWVLLTPSTCNAARIQLLTHRSHTRYAMNRWKGKQHIVPGFNQSNIFWANAAFLEIHHHEWQKNIIFKICGANYIHLATIDRQMDLFSYSISYNGKAWSFFVYTSNKVERFIHD